MNYIIINGKNSEEIEGLLISQLPSIFKPPKRVTNIEIDGVDGDFIEEIGYSAYDRELEIGLTRNCDIDEVISYFSSKGTIIFSNEPDKYYKFEIYEEIEFERLLKFKTAIIKIHCQPFKFLVDEPIRKKVNSVLGDLELSVYNLGNKFSKPLIEISGVGTLHLYLDNNQKLIINLGDVEEKIYIDTETLDAYDINNKLKNRSVVGDYENLFLNVGKNVLRITGQVKEIKVTNYNRWI